MNPMRAASGNSANCSSVKNSGLIERIRPIAARPLPGELIYPPSFAPPPCYSRSYIAFRAMLLDGPVRQFWKLSSGLADELAESRSHGHGREVEEKVFRRVEKA